MGETQQNKTWQVENTGIDIVPPTERTGKPLELFWIWCAANIGILGIVYGAIIVSFGLSFIQSLLAAIAGVTSFALVGYTSFAGLMVTRTGFIDGPWATGIFENSSLGLFLSFSVSGVTYGLYLLLQPRENH